MSKVEKRAAQRLQEWDFKTVVDGKEVVNADLSKIRQEQEEAAKKKEEEDRKKALENLKPIPGEQFVEVLTRTDNPPDPAPEPEKEVKERHFIGLEDFNRWYLQKKEEFSKEQQEAFDTLLKIEKMITTGCKCKENERRGVAYKYFQTFIVSNSETDLIQKIKDVGNFEKISFHVVEGADEFFSA
jgi:hypothetical protein